MDPDNLGVALALNETFDLNVNEDQVAAFLVLLEEYGYTLIERDTDD